ncbi:MAG: hypothetical protein JXA66_02420 [Oligoflexia bacterium]|nr:hypothetical protein [Oligoflexia bacterium]
MGGLRSDKGVADLGYLYAQSAKLSFEIPRGSFADLPRGLPLYFKDYTTASRVLDGALWDWKNLIFEKPGTKKIAMAPEKITVEPDITIIGESFITGPLYIEEHDREQFVNRYGFALGRDINECAETYIRNFFKNNLRFKIPDTDNAIRVTGMFRKLTAMIEVPDAVGFKAIVSKDLSKPYQFMDELERGALVLDGYIKLRFAVVEFRQEEYKLLAGTRRGIMPLGITAMPRYAATLVQCSFDCSSGEGTVSENPLMENVLNDFYLENECVYLERFDNKDIFYFETPYVKFDPRSPCSNGGRTDLHRAAIDCDVNLAKRVLEYHNDRDFIMKIDDSDMAAVNYADDNCCKEVKQEIEKRLQANNL